MFLAIASTLHPSHLFVFYQLGFGGGAGAGMPQMGMMGGMNGMNMGGMNGMNMGGMNGLGGGNNGNNNNGGGDSGNGNQGGDMNNANNFMANQAAFGGFNPMGGFQGGFPMGMGKFHGDCGVDSVRLGTQTHSLLFLLYVAGMGMPGMGMMGSVLGNANLLGAGGQMGGDNKDGDVSQADAASSANMAQQNMLMQQLLQQQAAAAGAGSLWQQYGAMQGADGMMGAGVGLPGGIPTSSYLTMLGQGGGVPGAAGGNREAGDTGVFQSGAIPDFAKSGKKSRPKKPKNKPKRPLSAYNIFFRDERAKILANIPDKSEEDEEDGDEKPVKKEEGEEGKDGEENAEGGEKKKTAGKKRKRIPHGKIGFESLAKIVGQRWKELEGEELEKYKKRAEEDMKRYRKEMEAYVQKQREGLEQSREHLEKLVDEETRRRFLSTDGA
jgi:hypothetical protein